MAENTHIRLLFSITILLSASKQVIFLQTVGNASTLNRAGQIRDMEGAVGPEHMSLQLAGNILYNMFTAKNPHDMLTEEIGQICTAHQV